MEEKKRKIAILIVAAGESKRLGQPKQLVKKNGIALLENSVSVAKKSGIGELFLVLGANAGLILKETELTDCQIFKNDNWQKGMGKSIAFGIGKITIHGSYTGVIVCVGDQPFLTANIFQKIEKKTSNGKIIIKSKYKDGSGPPVYFSHHFFEEMKNLSGDEGAKPLVKKYKKNLVSIDFLKGNIDIDREEDLKYWK